jgi:hypothetical protein
LNISKEVNNMSDRAYEKVVTGRSLSKIFGEAERLDIFENYLVHVETVDGAENNFIESMKDGHREVSDIYVSKDSMTSLKMV